MVTLNKVNTNFRRRSIRTNNYIIRRHITTSVCRILDLQLRYTRHVNIAIHFNTVKNSRNLLQKAKNRRRARTKVLVGSVLASVHSTIILRQLAGRIHPRTITRGTNVLNQRARTTNHLRRSMTTSSNKLQVINRDRSTLFQCLIRVRRSICPRLTRQSRT